MATSLTHELTYDAPVAAVGEMLRTPAFRERVCEAMHALRHDVTVEDRRVVVEFARSAHGVPSVARKLVGDEITIVQVEDWHAEDSARVTVTIPGKPGEMSGTATLRAHGTTTVHHVELQIQVRVPLVGAKIEAFIASMLRKALDRENETGREWLAEHGEIEPGEIEPGEIEPGETS